MHQASREGNSTGPGGLCTPFLPSAEQDQFCIWDTTLRGLRGEDLPAAVPTSVNPEGWGGDSSLFLGIDCLHTCYFKSDPAMCCVVSARS